MNILLTGGAGFIGSSLAEKLIDDNNIIVVDNFDDFYSPVLKEHNIANIKKNKNYKLYRTDITNFVELEKIFKENQIDTIIHLAAKAGVRPSIENPVAYFNSNILGTINILELMKKYRIKKLVFASSSSVYGNSKEDKFSEDIDTTKPISPYAATKVACEEFIYTYYKLYNINAVCLRFFTVYGPKQRPDLAIRKFVDAILKDKAITVFGDGSTCRDYTYIDDITDGICSALKYNETPYEIINLGGGKPVKLNDMISIIEKTLNKTAKKEYLPMQSGDVDKTVVDLDKAKKLLNYSPKVSFEDGIKNFIDWYLSFGNL